MVKVIKNEESLKEMLKRLPERRFVMIYRNINDDEWVYHKEFYHRWLEARESAEQIARWEDGHEDSGYFVNFLYAAKTTLFLTRKWVPAVGYKWDEYQVWMLEVVE